MLWIYTSVLFKVITPYATVSALEAPRILDVFPTEEGCLALTARTAEQY